MVVVLHGGFFQGAVAALDLAISAGMSRFGEVVPDAVLVVQAFENTLPGIALLKYYRNVCDPLSISYFINLAGHCSQDPAQTMRRQHSLWPAAATRRRPAYWCG